MALVLAIHGVGQQFKGSAVIHREWWPALSDGLARAGCAVLSPDQLDCVFYGDIFRSAGGLSGESRVRPEDLRQEEIELLSLLWDAASALDAQKVPNRAEFMPDESLARWPQLVQRALNSLSQSAFFAGVAQYAMLGDLRQTELYLTDPDVRERILERVFERLTEDTRVVLGHSLGSIVAYEALCRMPEREVHLVTIGSPLGIRNLVFDRLNPSPSSSGAGAWPGGALTWTNIADAGDVVALERKLSTRFGPRVRDVLVYNGSSAHHGERYLSAREVGEAVCAAIA
jgi:pimeloyl-ACP methyl ester carboxylesterase